ncbi:MAG: hypothetical protein ACM3Q2_00950 [Syntrophothermus sp.]
MDAVGIIGFTTGFTTKVDLNKEKELLAKKEMDFIERLNYVPPSGHILRGFIVGVMATIGGILILLKII